MILGIEMRIANFLEFRDKCRFIITEMRQAFKIPRNFYIDDIAVLDIHDLDGDEVRDEHIKFRSSRMAKALSKYNTNQMIRIDYLIHGNTNIHHDYIPAVYLISDYSEEEIEKDLQKRVQLREKSEISIFDMEEVYVLMTVDAGEL